MEYERRDLVYTGVRQFVGAYRDTISQGLVALPWPDAPERGATVTVVLQPPSMKQSFELSGEVSQRTEAGVVIALQPMASTARFELDGHVDLCEGIFASMTEAIQAHVDQGSSWSGVQITPCVGVIDAALGAASGKRELTNIVVNVDDLMQYLHLQRTHLDNRELFIQMLPAPATRTVVHVHLGLPYLGREVELRGVVSKSLSDGVLLDLAPYPRSTRRTFEWYWKLMELCAAEATAEVAKAHGVAAVEAIRALLPKTGKGIAELVLSEDAAISTTASVDAEPAPADKDVQAPPVEEERASPPEAEPEIDAEADLTSPVADEVVSATEVEPVALAPESDTPPPATEPDASLKSPPEAALSKPPPSGPSDREVPSIFARRRAKGSRVGTRSTPAASESPAVASSGLAPAPVVPVLLGDASSPHRQHGHDTLTSLERRASPTGPGREALSRMIGRGAENTSGGFRQRGVLSTEAIVAPPGLDDGPLTREVQDEKKSTDTHDDISIFKRPRARGRASTISQPGVTPPPPELRTAAVDAERMTAPMPCSGGLLVPPEGLIIERHDGRPWRPDLCTSGSQSVLQP